MPFLDLVKKRRSCRKYSEKTVPREHIERCLEAARWAPSACNSQPWRFIVVHEKRLKDELAEKAFSGIYQMNAFAKQAPVLVIVVREDSKYAAKVGGALRGIQYSLIDLGIACEHFVLQAAEQELGTCWIGWFNEGAVKKVLGLSRRERIDLIISMGYPQAPPKSLGNRKSLEEIREFRGPEER